MDATAKLIAIILLASFATERVLFAANYLLDAERLRGLKHRAAGRLRARERRRVLLCGLAAAIAMAVVDFGNLRISRLLELPLTLPASLDFSLTWLVLLAGADRTRELLKNMKSGAGAPAERKEVPAFRIHLEDDAKRGLREAS